MYASVSCDNGADKEACCVDTSNVKKPMSCQRVCFLRTVRATLLVVVFVPVCLGNAQVIYGMVKKIYIYREPLYCMYVLHPGVYRRLSCWHFCDERLTIYIYIHIRLFLFF